MYETKLVRLLTCFGRINDTCDSWFKTLLNNNQSTSVQFMVSLDLNTLFTNISLEGIYVRKIIKTNQTVPNLKN